MGFFDRFTGFLKRSTFSKDYNINDRLMSYYGEEATVDSYLEIEKLTENKFKETLDISDQILDKYKEKNNDDIQKELMKKYLKLSQDDINRQMLVDEQQESEQIDKELEGQNLSEEEKKKIKEETLEQKRKGEIPEDTKDKKKALQTRIYEATYNVMYKDYTEKVTDIKNAQFDGRDLSIDTKEAMEIIAMEKNLEKIDLLYHNHTGKEITKVERIKDKKEDFQHKMNYNEKGIQNMASEQAKNLDRLYKIRAEKYEQYIKALKNPNVSNPEKAMLKKEYQEANLDLIQNVPSLQEYNKDLEIEGQNKELVEEAELKQPSAATAYMYDNPKEQDTKPDAAKDIDRVQEDKLKRDEMSYEKSRILQEDAIKKGDIEAAKKMGDAQREGNIYEENIDKVPEQATISEINEQQEMEQRTSDSNFARSLRQVRNLDESSPEELEKMINGREQDEKEMIRKNTKEEIQKQEEYQREIRSKNKNNRPNN